MSVTQIIAELASLPEADRRKVASALRAMQPRKVLPGVRVNEESIQWPNLALWRRQVFGGKLHSNIVLDEREEATR